MAKLKDIKGTNIQFLDADPIENVGTWSSGGDLNTARGQAVGFGVTAAAGAAMGTTGSVVTNYEQYNGTSWTETTDINTAGRNGLGTGTTTAGLIYGGWPRAGKTESWNGSAWTEVGDMTRGANGSQSQAGGGTQTAAFGAGGEPGTTYYQLAEIWNGSAWTEVNDLNTLRQAAQGFGITTAGYVAAGYSPPVGSPYTTANVEVYNGSSWTETTNVNSKRGQGGGAGNATAGIIFGGATPSVSALTEFWDGSAWTEIADMSTARYQFGKTVNPSSGSTDALAIGGEVPSYVATTEEWAFPPSTSSILQEGLMWFNSGSSSLKGYGTAAGVPAGTWATGVSLNTGRYGGSFSHNGPITATIYFGGSTPSVTGKTESYNGTAYTEVADMGAARTYMSGGAGTQTAALGAGGEPGRTDNTQTWDGSSWSEQSELNTAASLMAEGGSQTLAIAVGGQNPGVPTIYVQHEAWDGSSWSETTEMSTGRYGGFAAGPTNANVIAFGGQNPGTTNVVNAEIWNGSSWTEVNNLNEGRKYLMGQGNSSQALATGGDDGSYVANVEYWNGSSWTEINNLGTATAYTDGSGSASSGMISGGLAPGLTSKTEEFVATAVVSTVTTS